LSSTYISRS